jgi:hypothetical protein
MLEDASSTNDKLISMNWDGKVHDIIYIYIPYINETCSDRDEGRAFFPWKKLMALGDSPL